MGRVKEYWMRQIDEVEERFARYKISRGEAELELEKLSVPMDTVRDQLDFIETVRDN